MSDKKLLEDEYSFQWKLGHGSFGEVWKVLEKKTNKLIAFKIEEKKSDEKSMLREEYKIYMSMIRRGLGNTIPEIYKFISTPKYNIMTMELLDKNLDKIFNENKKSFSLSTVLMIGMSIIKLLESVHKTGYIHRDIKPNNFMFRNTGNKIDMCIMDFGLAKKYISDGKHIPLKTGRSLIGTARYASINIHMGFEPSRRDDLISVGYMLIYFLKGTLPWQGLKKKSGIDHIENIGDKKLEVSIEKLCKKIPNCFKEYLKYCIELKFEETPNYNYLIKLFTDFANDNKINIEYEWTY
jgi:serine/threonine protein kinase